jgi:hypothetical protein
MAKMRGGEGLPGAAESCQKMAERWRGEGLSRSARKRLKLAPAQQQQKQQQHQHDSRRIKNRSNFFQIGSPL